jgi:CubicO group peptidase (beta-lactamase class C family)
MAAQGTPHGIEGLPTARPEAAGMSSARLALLGDAVRKEIAAERMPGAVVAIARRGQLVYYEAFGHLDKAAGTAMPKDAIFAIASMTKPIFSVAAMSLYEEGRLLMNEPVAAYLPELKDRRVATNADGSQTEPARRQPTIEDLMRHTSGDLSGDSNSGRTPLHRKYPESIRQITEHEYLSALARLPLRYQPGTTWEYGPGFDILGLAISRVARQPVYELLTQRVFGPLGMRDTHFTIPAGKLARQAKPLPKDPITGQPQVVRDQSRPYAVDCGGGCLASTAADYLRFAQMLLNGGSLNGQRVLGKKTVAYMTSDHAGPDIDLSQLYATRTAQAYAHGFGLGVAVRRGTGFGTTTGSPGDFKWAGAQGTAFWVDPQEQLAIVWMTQTPGDIRPIHRQMVPALVYQALLD